MQQGRCKNVQQNYSAGNFVSTKLEILVEGKNQYQINVKFRLPVDIPSDKSKKGRESTETLEK